MIKGIGIDIIEIDRIENIVSKNKRFLQKIFTEAEIDYIKSRNYNSNTISGLFSSKEAISKVLGTGISGFNWTDIEIIHDQLGKPRVKLKGNAKIISDNKNIDQILLSISHSNKDAISVAIGEQNIDKSISNIKNVHWTKGILIKREEDSHKGTYGRVGVIAGSEGMAGAPYLTSKSALRTGSGLVYSIVPRSIFTISQIKNTEVIVKSFECLNDIMTHSKDVDVVALGPGIGVNPNTIEMVKYILENLKKPIVLDADGINCVCQCKDVLLSRNETTIITPHPGEMSRLINVDISEIQKNREKYSMEVAKRYDVIVVLKGSRTVVCDGKDIYINTTGNPGMSTAGSGDVLTGVIASLLGQRIDALDAAKLGVYLHGLAGDIAKEEKGEYGLIASDIIDYIPTAINKIT